jgi:hypothetical protein
MYGNLGGSQELTFFSAIVRIFQFLDFLRPDSEMKKSPTFPPLALTIEEKKSTAVSGDILFLTMDCK